MYTPEVSIVVPVFNSAESLDELCSEVDLHLKDVAYEIILVEDGSNDNSWEKIELLKSKYGEKLVGVRLARNFGQHNALICGFTFAKGEAIVTIDDDLQHPPSEIPKLLEKFKTSGADVVYGIYEVKQHSTMRNAGGTFARRSAKVVVGHVGIGSSFRLMKKEMADHVVEHRNQSHLFIDEIIRWYTARFAQVPVAHRERRHGKSGYTIGKLILIYFDTVVNYTAVPLRMMIWLGLFSSIFTFMLGVRFIYRKFMFDVEPGFTAQIVTILFSTSLLMFCMGIIGQYLYKIYHLQSRRPPYSIHTVL
ncbi:MAG TPA: glycosyltransferase family 2 protein [Bacteroidia bacterium]|nr:glycosyltransferase family 2 protein [Bacteroidia bacterium]